MSDANVTLWRQRVGAVSWNRERAVGVFEYDPAFASAGIEISPLAMPVRAATYEFPTLNKETFKGLPGLLSDALPDSFGNRLINVWLAETGRKPEVFSPVDRLRYIGKRATGALEFEPAFHQQDRAHRLEIAQLVELANRALDERMQVAGELGGHDGSAALESILSVGTSAGGARPKAVLAWNPATGEFRSGQADAPEGFEHWIMKFDGMTDGRGGKLGAPQGFGRIEYAYSLMAREAGIGMADCQLHHEGGRSHFMTRRFDRDAKGRKLHMQSLGALQHYDFNAPGAHAYEQAMATIRQLGLGMAAMEEQFRRTVFNLVARNQDDHVKNISFLMDRKGAWRLSPAYDVIYAQSPSGFWTHDHQMSVAGKRNDFEREDVFRFAESSGLKKFTAQRILDEVVSAVRDWRKFATAAEVEPRSIERIEQAHRVALGQSGRKVLP